MECPKVVFIATGRGADANDAVRNATERSLPAAWHLCRSVSAECPEPGIRPLQAEFLDARPVPPEMVVRMRFTYQCHAPGKGCLTAPFAFLVGRAERPEPEGVDRPLEELLEVAGASSLEEPGS